MTHPLTPFAHCNWAVPYRFEETGGTVLVFPVRAKTGIVAARQGVLAHLEAGVAGMLDGNRVRFAARFLCGEGSADVAVVPSPIAYGGVCEQCVDVAAGPCMYRCFNDAASLIYVGSAERWLRRLANHRARTSWWPEVADVRKTHYRSIFEARAAETTATEAEKPLHNKWPRSFTRRIA